MIKITQISMYEGVFFDNLFLNTNTHKHFNITLNVLMHGSDGLKILCRDTDTFYIMF